MYENQRHPISPGRNPSLTQMPRIWLARIGGWQGEYPLRMPQPQVLARRPN
jgi:hypothetical protein